MTALQQDGVATGTQPWPRPRAALPALCITQITSWGVLYYAFLVLLSHISAQTGWAPSSVTAAFTLALLISAAVGIPIGRILDRHGPRTVMTSGSILAVAALAVVASAPNLPTFYAGWCLAGTAMAATLYPPAFAALTRWHGPDRVRALTILTLAGGLASTVFAPITASLAEHLNWRTTYMVLGAVLAAVTIPAHALALRSPWPTPDTHVRRHESAGTTARSRSFVLLTAAFALSAFAMFAVVSSMVPLLSSRGTSPSTAAWALGLGGLGQTLGRSLYSRLSRHTTVIRRTGLLIAAGGATTLGLGLVTGPVPLVVTLAICAGTVRGNLTLLQATAVPDRWGAHDYGRLSSILGAPATVTAAFAPWVATAMVRPLGGYPHLFVALAVVSAVAAATAMGSTRSTSEDL